MPSLKHEALLMLLRSRPALAPELLSQAFGVELPHHDEVRIEPAELSKLEPAVYQADLVVALRKGGASVLAVVVEVQLRRDGQKRSSWPEYLTGLHARLGGPVYLLVVAPNASVARWCARPIALGHPGFVLQPLVLGPEGIPVVLDAEQAKSAPEIAVLSAVAHGKGEQAVPVAVAALAAAAGLDDERARLYIDLVMASLGAAARRALEEMMQNGSYQYQSDFARKYVAQGRAEGRAEGRAQAVLTVLRARSIEVGSEAEQRILACTDIAELDAWIGRVATVQSVEDLFG